MKRKLNEAFTLIELLAVIVILAIIALIATPIILGIVEDARKDSFLRSVELVVSTTDIDIANKTFEEMYTYEIVDGDISNLEIGVKNTKGMNGTITYDTNGNEEYAIHNGVYCVRKTSNMENAEISDFDGECANIEYTDASCFVTAKTVVYEITDKEKCQTFWGQMDYSSEEAVAVCNNEPMNGMTLAETLQNVEDMVGLETILSMLPEMGVTRIEIENDEVIIKDYTCEDIEIAIPPKIDGLAVTSIAYRAFQNKGLTSVRFPNSITKIGAEAFSENNLSGELDLSKLTRLTTIERKVFSTNKIESIKFSSSIKNIEKDAFEYNKLTGELDLSYLTGLTNIEDYAFSGTEDGSTNQITALKLPNSLITIGDSAFKYNKLSGELDLRYLTNLTNLSGFSGNEITSVKLPNSVKEISNHAFSRNKLTDELDLSYLTGLEVISGSYAFGSNDITSIKLPSSVTSIGDYAFAEIKLGGELDLSYLTSLTRIGKYAFAGSSDGSTNQITSLKLPSSVAYIGGSAFIYNKLSGELDLSHLTRLTDIGDYAFYGSSSTNQITSLKLPSSVTNIRDGAFAYNELSGELDLSNLTSLTTIGKDAFAHNELSGELDLSYLTGLTYLGSSAFEGSSSTNQITSIKLPSSITHIGMYAFKDNKLGGELDLSHLTGLTSIGYGAFQGSSNGSTNQITALKLPNSLITIRESAFQSNALTSVTFYGRSDLTGITVGIGAWGWASGYNAENNIYFVNE